MTCQYILPRHSSKPSGDKDKDMKKARRKKKGGQRITPPLKSVRDATGFFFLLFTNRVPITCKTPVGAHAVGCQVKSSLLLSTLTEGFYALLWIGKL